MRIKIYRPSCGNWPGRVFHFLARAAAATAATIIPITRLSRCYCQFPGRVRAAAAAAAVCSIPAFKNV